MSSLAIPTMENHVMNITQEIRVNASLEKTFAALLEQLGPGFDNPDGKSMQMKLEAWAGGRWFRDLGDNNGHFWGNVQAIKRPTLLEISGPLMMSYAVVNNVQYRLTQVEGGTLIAFHHYAFGVIPEEFRDGMPKGWTHIIENVRKRAESKG
jgi:uncharacterized protein YndB with AHSA1/START domain